jgi:hypothetical protein
MICSSDVVREAIIYPRLDFRQVFTSEDLDRLIKIDTRNASDLTVEMEIRANILLNLKRGMKGWG